MNLCVNRLVAARFVSVLLATFWASITPALLPPAMASESRGPASPESPEDGPAQPRRPVVALALSGGGARGAAHVGVLKALEHYGVPIDIITGTSAGAIVGGLYAVGNTPDQIEEVLRSTDWRAALDDSPPRARRTQNTRADERTMLAREVAGVDALEVKPPTALVQGQQFDFLLRNLTLPASDIRDFDRLRVRFRALATDAVTGDSVVLGSGDLALAIRASMAVPAVFSAVEIDGRLLIDGGVSNNLPVSVAIEMGADIVIAVDISTPLRKREQIGSLLDMMDQMTGFLTVRNTNEQLARLRASDLLLRPAVDAVTTSDFARAHEVVVAGEQAAAQARDRLERIADLARAGAAPSDARARAELLEAGNTVVPPVIRFLRFENPSALRDEMLEAKLRGIVGKPLDLDSLKLGIDRIYALEAFETVRYRLVEEGGETGVVVSVLPRSWGRDALRFGLRMGAERRRGSDFDVSLAYEARAINELNAKWRTELQLGQTTMLATELYQPIDAAEYWFFKARLSSSETLRKFYRANDALSEYMISRTGVLALLGANVDRYGDVRVGFRRFSGSARLAVGDGESFPRYSFDEANAFVGAEFDSLDSIQFPRSGRRMMLVRTQSVPQFGASADYRQIEARTTVARSWGAHTLVGQADLGLTTGGFAPIEARFSMGGLFSMPGYNIDALLGQQLARGALTYLNSVGRYGLLPLYVGAAWHVGNVWDERSAIRGSKLLKGGSLFAGTDTLIGPVYLGLGISPGAGSAVYLNLGQPAF
jgi:NTE family protein